MKRALPFLFAVLCLAIACGKQGGSNNTPVNSCQDFAANTDPKKVTLVIFGAPPCENCKRDFPDIQNRLRAIPAEQRKSLGLQLYVETGGKWTDGPTQSVAEQYRNGEGLCFNATPDGKDSHGRPTYATYIRFTKIPLSRAAVPAGVLLDENGNVTDTFSPGDTSFDPKRIVDTVSNRLTGKAAK